MNNDEIMILNKKIKDFNHLINTYEENNSFQELIFKEKLNDLLGQIEVCLKKTDVPNKDKELISAIKYVNNMKKHSKSIFTYSKRTTALFPSNNLYSSNSLFPLKFKIWWSDLPLDGKDYRYQYNCYKKGLQGKDVLESLNKIYDIVESNQIK